MTRRSPGANPGLKSATRIFDAPTIREDCDNYHDPVQLERERAAIARAALAKALLMEALNLGGSRHAAIWTEARVARLERRRRMGVAS